MKKILPVAFIATLFIPAFAEEPAPIAIAKHNCVKPEAPSKFASDSRQKQFRKEVDALKACMVKYGEDQRKLAEAAIAAGNAAIQEYNEFVKSLQPDEDKK